LQQDLAGQMEVELRALVAQLAAAARDAGELRVALADAVPRSAVDFERCVPFYRRAGKRAWVCGGSKG
jgi:hypothetical protein